jgi:uncharacterized protein
MSASPTTAAAMPPLVRFASLAALAALTACATTPPAPATLPDDKRRALEDFVVAYRLALVWPQMAPKIARDSLPRLEDATHVDIDHDRLDTPAASEAAHARVAALMPQGRRELQDALLRFDAAEFARQTAYRVWAKYFDTAEIRQITAFYDSATGRKLSALGPALVAEHRRPGGPDPLDRHFDAGEQAEIGAFWNSPVGRKLNTTAEQVREDMHTLFTLQSEPVLQAVARRLATQAESPTSSGF